MPHAPFPMPNNKDYTHQLQQLMQRVGISSFKELSKKTGVSERSLRRLRSGQVLQMRVETVVKISQTLQVSVNELLNNFGEQQFPAARTETELKQEYERLRQQLEQQREHIKQEFQLSSLQVLESWLTFWPTAVYAVQQNPQLEAVKIINLVKPVEKLVQQWGVEAIGTVGEEVIYDPQWHQLIEGTASKGDHVKVSNTGYRQGDKLLFRTKVKAII